jgi:hypothetical protein
MQHDIERGKSQEAVEKEQSDSSAFRGKGSAWLIHDGPLHYLPGPRKARQERIGAISPDVSNVCQEYTPARSREDRRKNQRQTKKNLMFA